jgi:hypothetical protein
MKLNLLISCFITCLLSNQVLLSQDSDSLHFDSLCISTKKINIYIIPIGIKIKRAELNTLPSYFQKAKIQLTPYILAEFNTKSKEKWANPSSDGNRYTEQMKKIRDSYFSSFKNREPNAFYVFVIPGFNNPALSGFSIPTKGLMFISSSPSGNLSSSIAEEILHSFGIKSEKDSVAQERIPNLFLSWKECIELRKNPLHFGIHDDYEFVRTNNGLVAYYFWKENKNKEISIDSLNPLNAIIRPYKTNAVYRYLDISNWFFKPQFLVFQKQICIAHLTGISLTLLLLLFFRRKINLKITKSAFVQRMSFRLVKLLIWGLAILLVYSSFLAVNYYLKNSYLKSHKIAALKNYQLTELIANHKNTALFACEETTEIQSQIYIKTKKNYLIQKGFKVLYFYQTSPTKMKFYRSSNTLKLKGKQIKLPASTHYIVIRNKNKQGEIVSERIFNHLGIEITHHILQKDPIKRILVFVNGYRPVSISNDFEKNMDDIKQKGLEYPNSENHLFNFDRYSYWRPWSEIDLLFQARLNADNIWYADGHHSVATSNHRSILNFSTNSVIYPKPCKNLNKHHCKFSENATKQKVNSYELLATKSNVDGFALRKKNGEIAGKNLKQILNELPNQSKNDTLFIVAHSMGFAYSLGILNELRGKINFGGFYIIAPENAEAGKVKVSEWKDIVHYGCNLSAKNKTPACLQDGIAPQSNIQGLSSKEHVYFPMELQKRMGYLGSHFIGNYLWTLEIPKDQPGHIWLH